MTPLKTAVRHPPAAAEAATTDLQTDNQKTTRRTGHFLHPKTGLAMVDWTAYNLIRSPYFTSPLGPPTEPASLFVGHERELPEALSAVAAGNHHMVMARRGMGSTSFTNCLKEQSASLGVASHLEPVLMNGRASPNDLMIQIVQSTWNALVPSRPEGTEARTAFADAAVAAGQSLRGGASALTRALENAVDKANGIRFILVHLTMGGIRTADLQRARKSLVSLHNHGMFSIPSLRFVIEGPTQAVSLVVGQEARLRAEIGDYTVLLPITADELREALARRYTHFQNHPNTDVTPPVDIEAAVQLHDLLNGELRRTFYVLGRTASLISRHGQSRTGSWDDVLQALHARGRL